MFNVIWDISKCLRSSTMDREVSSLKGLGIALYTEVSSFQGVGIGEFHCIQRWGLE